MGNIAFVLAGLRRSLDYLDREVLQQISAARGEGVEEWRTRNINKGGDWLMRRDKGPGRDSTAGESWPDKNARILLDRFDALKPKISFCGLYFWVIMSSSPSRTCVHIPPFCPRSINREIVKSEVCLSLSTAHFIIEPTLALQSWYRQRGSRCVGTVLENKGGRENDASA